MLTPTEWKQQFRQQTGIKPRIIEMKKKCEGADVLNIGCIGGNPSVDGKNWLHGQLSLVADTVVGIDIDSKPIESLSEAGWDVYLDDAESLDNIEEDFDVVVAGEVIEHLSCPGAMLEAVKPHLKMDGTLLLSTPNPWAFVYFRRLLSGKDPVGNEEHTCWFDKTTLGILINRHGYDVEIKHLEPSTTGISSLLYPINSKLGGTRLFAEIKPNPK